MTDLCKELALRSRIAAYVLGDGCRFQLCWLHEKTPNAVIADCARRGFRRCGVIGLVGEKVEMVAAFGAEGLMVSARDQFELTLMQRMM